MENFESIGSYIEKNNCEDVVRMKKSIVLPSIMIITSIGIYMMVRSKMFEAESVSMFVSCVYVVLFGYGLISLILRIMGNKSDYVLISNKKKLRERKVYISASEVSTLKLCIDNNNFSQAKKIKIEQTSGAYIDVLGADDGSFYMFQIFEYIPHSYEPVSEVIRLNGDNATAFHQLIQQAA